MENQSQSRHNLFSCTIYTTNWQTYGKMAKVFWAQVARTQCAAYPKGASSEASADFQSDTWMEQVSRQTLVSISRRSLDKE
jgi:hypothetical protein